MVMPDESEIMIFNGGNIYGPNPNASLSCHPLDVPRC